MRAKKNLSTIPQPNHCNIIDERSSTVHGVGDSDRLTLFWQNSILIVVENVSGLLLSHPLLKKKNSKPI